MNGQSGNVPMSLMELPTEMEAAAAVEQARRLYARVLAGWASDALLLRKRGVHRLLWRSSPEQNGWTKAAA